MVTAGLAPYGSGYHPQLLTKPTLEHNFEVSLCLDFVSCIHLSLCQGLIKVETMLISKNGNFSDAIDKCYRERALYLGMK